MNEETRVVTKSEIGAFAAEILSLAKTHVATGAVVIALRGDLGAGKTTFVQELAKTLGVTEPVTSPTFTILKGYATTDADFEHLIHMDAYRIDDISELGPLRFTEILSAPRTLFCIEWAEKIKAALPAQVLSLTLEVADQNTRTVHIARE